MLVKYRYRQAHKPRGPGSVVIIATGYGLDVQGSNPGGRARFSAPVQTGPGAHPASCTMGTGSFPGVKSGRGVMLNPHPLLGPWSRKGRAIPLLPYGPYGLYRASVPVQGCTLLNTGTFLKRQARLFHLLTLLCVKVKCTLVQALRLCTGRTAHTRSRGIALFFHDHGTRRG